MSKDDTFTPRLGRPGDAGSGAGRRFARSIRKRAARLAKPKAKPALARGRIQRGTAAARMASFRQARFPAHRIRRVVVQVYIARAAKSGGAASFAKHAHYLQRDGVDRDGHAGEVYDRDRDRLDAESFVSRSKDDRHQFRIMVSPEDGAALDDLKPHIRNLMGVAEKDLGTRLDWIAVDHHNTGRPHTHIIVRGRADDGGDLVISKDYLTKGLRRRASELVTEALGPRRDLEILRAKQQEVHQDRFTGLDRWLAELARENTITLASPRTSGDRFEGALVRRRLGHLKQLGLATRNEADRWTLSKGWEETLRRMGRREDLIRSITAKYAEQDIANRIALFDPAKHGGEKIVGRVLGSVPVDELRARRHVLVEGLDGKTWSVDLGAAPSDPPPKRGAIVEVTAATRAPKRSDKTIARIAALNNGLWSEAIHGASDPGATPEYRLAHKRRLEALRRARYVERRSDGVWTIPADYLERAAQFEARKTGGADISLVTPLPIRAMETASAHTWLDRVDGAALAETGFGGEVRRAQAKRLTWLREQGLLRQDDIRLSTQQANALKAQELSRVAAKECAASAREGGPLVSGRSFSGTFEKIIETHQGRFALIGDETRFALAPLRQKMASSLGHEITVTRKGQSVDWTIGRKRGLGR